MSGDAPSSWVADLPARLSDAVGPGELLAATRPPEGSRIARGIEADVIAVGARRLRSCVPRVILELDPPADARALCAAWRIEQPVAVSNDVHQASWSLVVAGAELPEPHGRRICTDPFTTGRWEVRIGLARRPSGPLPDGISGASPAYDVLERGGEVRRIEVLRAARRTGLVQGHHPDARSLLEAMWSQYPSWGAGWHVAPAIDFVVVYSAELPVAGAALSEGDAGSFLASRLCALAEEQIGDAGSTLLETLEAVALDRGGRRLRLDPSAFLLSEVLPYRRHGYVVMPPYDGDADVAVWVEREFA